MDPTHIEDKIITLTDQLAVLKLEEPTPQSVRKIEKLENTVAALRQQLKKYQD